MMTRAFDPLQCTNDFVDDQISTVRINQDRQLLYSIFPVLIRDIRYALNNFFFVWNSVIFIA